MDIRIQSGFLKGRTIKAPKTTKTRPITSYLKKSMFDTCQVWIQDARILDLFAGSGAIGIEGLSRGARHCLFIDLAKEPIDTIKDNLAKLDLKEKATVIRQDAFKWLLNYDKEPFDIIFIDPPYPIGEEGYKKLMLSILENPLLLHDTTYLFLETPSQIKQTLETFLDPFFTILKEKTSSTTTLFCLQKK